MLLNAMYHLRIQYWQESTTDGLHFFLKMTMPQGDDLATLRERYAAHGQGHVLEHVTDDMDLTSFQKVPIEHLATWYQQATSAKESADDCASTTTTTTIEPFPSARVAQASKICETVEPIGLQAISQGQLAVLVLAGGQGTRLGYDGPKGMYELYPTESSSSSSSSSLFALLAMRLRKLSLNAASTCSVPLYIMTSPMNDATTRDYFQRHDNFGLDHVHFFTQGMLPCLSSSSNSESSSSSSRILMESPTQMAMAPDGNGGVYTALHTSGALQDMIDRGVLYVHAVSIDNCCTLPGDPVLCGYAIQQGADVGNKVVWKRHAHEKVGVMAQQRYRSIDGEDDDVVEPCIVEYSEISKEMAELTNDDDDKKLVFGAANICNHWYTVDFLQRITAGSDFLPYHAAHKKIPYWDGSQTVTPKDKNNGIKLETFIFDVFRHAKQLVVLEVDRADEFSPVKNATGNDSPDTARDHLRARNIRWLTAAGATIVNNDNQDDDDDEEGSTAACRISPLTSYAGEGLEEIVAKYPGGKIELPFSV